MLSDRGLLKNFVLTKSCLKWFTGGSTHSPVHIHEVLTASDGFLVRCLIFILWYVTSSVCCVSADVLWSLPAWRGGRGRLWFPGGRHQTGVPPVGSTGERLKLIMFYPYCVFTVCLFCVYCVLAERLSYVYCVCFRRVASVRGRERVSAATSEVAGRWLTFPAHGKTSSSLSSLDSSRECRLHIQLWNYINKASWFIVSHVACSSSTCIWEKSISLMNSHLLYSLIHCFLHRHWHVVTSHTR